MKVLISGSRTWLSQIVIEERFRKLPPGTTIIHGGAPGVDNISGYIARLLGFPVRSYPALAHGRKWPEAGVLRNAEMLEKEHPFSDGSYIDQALIFHEDPGLGKGTRDMHKRLKLASPVIPIEIFIGKGR